MGDERSAVEDEAPHEADRDASLRCQLSTVNCQLTGRVAVAAFFLGPAAFLALAVSLRTTRTIESFDDVIARVLSYAPVAQAAAEGEGVDVALLYAVASAESSGRADARSGADAVGLMQLLPSTAADMARALGEPKPDLTDPATSLRLGARYLRQQLDRFASSRCPKEPALAAYNAGPQNVRAWLDAGREPTCDGDFSWIPFGETRAFVRRVLEYERRYRAAAEARPAR